MKHARYALALAAVLTGLAAPVAAETLDYAGWYARARGYVVDKAQPSAEVRGKLLTELSVATADRDAIDRMRSSETVAKVLAAALWLGDTSETTARKSASLVIVNVADNTNVCVVTRYVRDHPQINEDFLFNLMQALRLVASYAYAENVRDITDLVDQLDARLPKESEATRRALVRVREAMQNNKENASRPLPEGLAALRTKRCSDTP